MIMIKTPRWKGLAAGLMLLPGSGVCAPPALTELMGFAGSHALPIVAPAASRPFGVSRGVLPHRSFSLRFGGLAQSAAPAASSGKITFDEVSAAASAQDYLSRLGISVKDLTTGTKLEVLDATKVYAGQAV